MNVLIIGGAGFVGSNLVRRCLAQKSCRVTVMDSLEPHGHPTTEHLKQVWSKIRFVRGDIRNETLLAEIVQDQDIIFNCAAQPSHALSVQYPLLDTDISCIGSLKLLETLRLLNKDATVVFTSTTTTIGETLSEFADEDHPERPLEIYSANKGAAEKYYRIYHRHYDLKTVVLRFPNLYGPFGKGHKSFGFINYFIHLAWTNQNIQIFGEGCQTRNIMYVEDATDILWRAAHEPDLIGETYLAAGSEHATVNEIAETIVDVFDRGKVTHVDWPDERRRIEVGDVRLRSDRLRAITKWEPRYDLMAGLHRTKTTLEQKSS
ncbi:MAG: NAD-dependent epimerase/dehydratase family protein [Kiritimatiellae bacterium]|nr:NAD-dependent epimerase/dehydratase family protein [Kiritimatiellia bacterium]